MKAIGCAKVFAPRCGVRMFYRIEQRPGMTSVPVGIFRYPDFPAPTIDVYGELAMRAMRVTIDPPPEFM